MQTLNQGWPLATDSLYVSKQEGWYTSGPTADANPAPVPGLIQDLFPNYHGVAWYWNSFQVEGDLQTANLAADRLRLDLIRYAQHRVDR